MAQKYFLEKGGEQAPAEFLQEFNGSDVVNLKQARAGFGDREIPVLDM